MLFVDNLAAVYRSCLVFRLLMYPFHDVDYHHPHSHRHHRDHHHPHRVVQIDHHVLINHYGMVRTAGLVFRWLLDALRDE